MTEAEVIAQRGTAGRKPETQTRPRCPLCDGPMNVKTGKNGEFLGCLRFPDCKGRKNLDAPIPEVKGESTPRQLVESPILGLTKAALSGLLANPATVDWSASEIGENAVGCAAATLVALKLRTERKHDAGT